MASIDGNPSIAQFLVYNLGRWLARKQDAKAQSRAEGHTSPLYSLVRLVLHLAGFSLLTYAGFTVNITTGLIVAGVSCFVLSTLVSVPRQTPNSDPMARR
jgi:hypothetical protein